MTTENQFGRYEKNGYLLVRRFFDPEELRRIHDDAKMTFALQMKRLGLIDSVDVVDDDAEFDAAMVALFKRDLATFVNTGKQAQHLISLHRLSLDDRIIEQVQKLGLKFPNISTRPVLYFNAETLATKEVYWRLEPHQDWRSMQGSLDSIVVWLPLVDIDRDLGALEILPGSHLWGLQTAKMIDGYGHLDKKLDRSDFMSVEVKRGDALFFSTLLLHQSGTNVTSRIRWSCHFRYNNLVEPTFIERGFPHPYLYKPQEELITPNFPSEEQVRNTFSRSPQS